MAIFETSAPFPSTAGQVSCLHSVTTASVLYVNICIADRYRYSISEINSCTGSTTFYILSEDQRPEETRDLEILEIGMHTAPFPGSTKNQFYCFQISCLHILSRALL